MSKRWWRGAAVVAYACACVLAACELVADFDRDKLDDERTLGPTPLPTSDGAIAVVPEGGRPDGALIPPDTRDAGRFDATVRDAQAVPDASGDGGAADVVDAAGIDARVEPPQVGAEDPDASVVVGGDQP